MPHKQPLSAMGITSVNDLGVLDSNPPPLDWARDIHLSPTAGAPISYKSPSHDTFSYFGPS